MIHGLVWEFSKLNKKVDYSCMYKCITCKHLCCLRICNRRKNSLSLFQTSVHFFSYLCLIKGNNCDSWFSMRILLCVLHTWKIAKLVEIFSQKCFTQGRHGNFFGGKDAIVAPTSLAHHCCRRHVLFPKIQPRTKPWLPCLLWRPCYVST